MEPRQEFIRFFSDDNGKIKEEIRLKHSIPNKALKGRRRHDIKIFKKARKRKKD